MTNPFDNEKITSMKLILKDEAGNTREIKEKDLKGLIFFGVGLNGNEENPDAILRVDGKGKYITAGTAMLLEAVIEKIGIRMFMIVLQDLFQELGIPMIHKSVPKEDIIEELKDDIFASRMLNVDKKKLPN